MNEPPEAGRIDDELFWTAAQYAAGDLPDEAATEFEQRLETDQTAREALAQAVMLSAAVVQVEATPVVSTVGISTAGSPRRWTVGAAWIVVATAACVALTFAVRSGSQGDKVAEVRSGDVQLAAVWVENQTQPAVATVDETFFIAAAEDDVEFELPPMNIEPSAPDWLIAAVVDAESSPVRGEN